MDTADWNYTVRELHTSDMDKLEGLLDSLVHLRKVRENLSNTQIKSALEKINAQDGHVFVVIHEGKILGVATVLIEQKIIHDAGRVAHVEDVSVNEEHTGQGVGTVLMNKLIEYAHSRKCYKIILDCKPELESFYKRHGFRSHEIAMRRDF